MYYVGPCPICSNGLRGVRVCCDTPVVLCDECDALWSSPSIDDRVSAKSDPPCGRCQSSLWMEQAHWASRDEIEQAGWWAQVEGEAGERSSSGGPRVPDEITKLIDASSDENQTSSGDDPSSDSAPSSRDAGRSGGGHLLWVVGLAVLGAAATAIALL